VDIDDGADEEEREVRMAVPAPLTEEELDALDEKAEGVFERDDYDEVLELAHEAMGAVHRQRALLADKDAELERIPKLESNIREGDALYKACYAELTRVQERAARLEALLKKFQYEFDYDANHKECIGCGEREGASCAEDCPIEAELLRKDST
jgi:hypothetical protein